MAVDNFYIPRDCPELNGGAFTLEKWASIIEELRAKHGDESKLTMYCNGTGIEAVVEEMCFHD